MRIHVVLIAVAGLALLTSCSEETVTPSVELSFDASNWSPAPGEVVVFTVTGSTSQGAITQSGIDFEGDNNWDDYHLHNSPTISTSFSHAYPSPGTHEVRVEIKTTVDGVSAQQTRVIGVGANPD